MEDWRDGVMGKNGLEVQRLKPGTHKREPGTVSLQLIRRLL